MAEALKIEVIEIEWTGFALDVAGDMEDGVKFVLGRQLEEKLGIDLGIDHLTSTAMPMQFTTYNSAAAAYPHHLAPVAGIRNPAAVEYTEVAPTSHLLRQHAPAPQAAHMQMLRPADQHLPPYAIAPQAAHMPLHTPAARLLPPHARASPAAHMPMQTLAARRPNPL